MGYVVVMTVLLGLAVTGTTAVVFPRLLARHVAEDSEGVLLALLLPLWLLLARPRLSASRWQWPLTLAASTGCLTVGAWLYVSTTVLPKVGTLNETFLALALLLPYVQLARPVRRRLVLGLPAAVLLVVAVAFHTRLVTDLAEGLAMLVLLPIGLDVVDRGILEPEVRTSPRTRWAWYAGLVAAPICFILLNGAVGGVLGEVVRYATRVQEAFVGVLLVQLCLAVALGRTGARDAGGRSAVKHLVVQLGPGAHERQPDRPQRHLPGGDADAAGSRPGRRTA